MYAYAYIAVCWPDFGDIRLTEWVSVRACERTSLCASNDSTSLFLSFFLSLALSFARCEDWKHNIVFHILSMCMQTATTSADGLVYLSSVMFCRLIVHQFDWRRTTQWTHTHHSRGVIKNTSSFVVAVVVVVCAPNCTRFNLKFIINLKQLFN